MLEVIYPPDGRAEPFQGNLGMVQVVLTRQRDTFFGRAPRDPDPVGRDRCGRGSPARRDEHALADRAQARTDCATAKVRGTATIKIYPVPGYTGPGRLCPGELGLRQLGRVTTTARPRARAPCDIDGNAAHLTAPKVNVTGGCKGHIGATCRRSRRGRDADGRSARGPGLPGMGHRATGSTVRAERRRHHGTRRPGVRPGWRAPPVAGMLSDSACPGLPSGHDCIELGSGHLLRRLGHRHQGARHAQARASTSSPAEG